MKIIRNIIPNLIIVVSVMLLVFLIIDLQNDAMQFINNPITKGILLVFSVLTIAASIRLIQLERR